MKQEVPCIVGGGVYPGLSNVMAAHIISANKKEYSQEGFHQEAPPDAGPVSSLSPYLTADAPRQI